MKVPAWIAGSRQHTSAGVFEIVGWRGRAERGVKPTEIGVPSIIKHVNTVPTNDIAVRYLDGEVCMFLGQDIRGLGDKEPLVDWTHSRHTKKLPNHWEIQ